ncbi:MAG: rod-binding protein [Armatimonadetes bacterium]|nr:rod-binding protein [Armatimonadota bacterium]
MSSFSPIAQAATIASAAGNDLKKLRGATQNIEAMFLKNMLAEMRKGKHPDLFGKSFGGDIYKDMMDQTMAENASKSSQLGIGDVLYKQFARDILRQAESRVREAHNLQPKSQATSLQGDK